MSDVLLQINGEQAQEEIKPVPGQQEEEQKSAEKPKLQLPGSEAVKEYERRQRIKQQNLPILRMAAIIYRRYLNSKNGPITKKKAVEMAKRVKAKKEASNESVSKNTNSNKTPVGELTKYQDMADQQKMLIINRLKKVYEHYGYPPDLHFPVLTVAHVVNFSERTRKRYTEFLVQGQYSQTKLDLARSTALSIRKVLDSVSEAKVNVLCHASVGNPVGVIKSVSNVFEEGETDIVHKDGQVILIMFYASWCNYCKIEMTKTQKMVTNN